MAILINNERFACASCIRGHRVKKCDHKDRPLIAIVKRGRQVSQCNHCRVLRKTNGSHVKCTCAMSGAPNPITGCLCEVINDCSCVASHLREVKIDDNSSEVDSTGFSDEANSLAVLSPQATDFLNTINSGIAANPADAELQPLMQPTSSNTVESTAQISKVQSSEPHMNPANITQNDFNTFVPHIQNASTILGEQDQDLANFLFNDLDKYLT